MIRVAVTDLEYDKAARVFAGVADLECVRVPTGEPELAKAIRDNGASHVIIGVTRYGGELYDALPRGGVIARFGVGHDGVDKQKAHERGLYCVNTPGVLDDSVAECVFGLMLGVCRDIARNSGLVRAHSWAPAVGLELKGRTIAVIGCGAIGRKVAKIAKQGFGMRVVGCDVVPTEDSSLDAFYTDFAEAVADADFVSLHIPDTPVTRDFVNVARLAMLGPSAVLINTARGAVLDEDALYDALSSGALAGAALDVFKIEPYAPQTEGKDLRDLDNVLMTSHIGSSTVDACRRMAEAALRNIRLAIDGNHDRMTHCGG